MTKTLWPFIEWTETIDEQNLRKVEVKEEIVIGEDIAGNMGSITRVELFSCGVKPHTLSISGDKVVGITTENRRGEYSYYGFFENVVAGEKKILEVLIEGESTFEQLKPDGYYSNFAWNSSHTQRIVFPKEWKILSAIPKDYKVETFRGRPSVVWYRKAKFWGNVQVKLSRN